MIYKMCIVKPEHCTVGLYFGEAGDDSSQWVLLESYEDGRCVEKHCRSGNIHNDTKANISGYWKVLTNHK